LAFTGIKQLSSILEEMERTDLLSELASFGNQMISQWNQNKLEYVTKNRIYIDYFTFADGIVELSDLREQFYYKIEDTPWAVWEQLAAISWCYKTPANYWKNKRLRYSDSFTTVPLGFAVTFSSTFIKASISSLNPNFCQLSTFLYWPL
jgi:hypothetical protein